MRSVKSDRRQAVLFCVCLFASLTLAEFLSAQVTTYEGTFQGPHDVVLQFDRDRCPIVRVPESGPVPSSELVPRGMLCASDGLESFEISGIPSNFACEIFRFRGGSVTVMAPVEDVTVQLLNPTTIPATVPLSTAVESSISARGEAVFRDGSDEHSIRAGIGIGLIDARSRIENRQPRDEEACSDQDDYTAREVGTRRLSASASCTIDTMNVVQGSVKTNEVGQANVTEFEAEVISDVYIIMDHGRARTGRRLDRGGRYTLTIRSRYLFQATGAAGAGPITRDDYVTGYLNTPVTIPVLANDQAANGLDPASVSVAQNPINGAAVANGDGTLTYTPAPGFFGKDSLTYTVSDSQGVESQPATANITVVNAPPFTGCRFTRTNQHLHFHHPALYSDAIQALFGFPALTIEVKVLRESQPVESGVPVQVSASQIAFPGASGLPESSSASGQTGENGAATFDINPPKPNPTDTTQFTGRVTIDGTEHTCQGTLVTGLGVQLLPYIDTLDSISQALFPERVEAGGKPRPEVRLAADHRRDEHRPAGGDQPRQIRVPLIFEENRGQAEDSADFVARVAGAQMLLRPQGVLLRAKGVDAADPASLEIIGSNAKAKGRAVERLPGRSHYLVGGSPSDWLTGIPQAAKVQFDEVYPGIDVVYYGNRRRLEYDFVVAPGADPGRIALRFPSIAPASLAENGDLVVSKSRLSLRLRKPLAYQEIEGERLEIACAYRLDGAGNVGFDVGRYDPERTLVIDPVLEFSSYVGGAADDSVSDVAVDQQGNIYIAGSTSSPGLATANALQSAKRDGGLGQTDAFVAKLDPTGSSLIYLTYIGGSGDESGFGIAVDSGGNVLATGTTSSADFPTVQALQDQFANAGDLIGFDAFALKLNPEGSGLVYSTYLGGSRLEIEGAIAVDAEGNAYIAGDTDSADLPLKGAFQTVSGGLYDAFVMKLDPTGSTVEYATYMGGSGNDGSPAAVVDAAGNVYVAGVSLSPNFPVTIGALQTSSASEVESFVAKLAPGDPPPMITSVSAASFSAALGMASESIASGFGADLAGAVAVANTVPLPTVLAGTSVKVTDSARTEQLAQLFFVSPGQINYLFPAGVAAGLATVAVERDGQQVATGTVRVNPVAPSLFSADASGTGVAAAFFLRIAADQTRSQELLFDPSTGAAVPVGLGPQGDQVYLLLFGTGIRGFTSEVTATVGGEDTPLLGAVAHPDFAGLDQVNIGPIPRSLIGAGEVEIILVVDGIPAPAVTVVLM